MRVLILESDQILANNLAQALQRAGHTAEWRTEPQSAINSADKKQPDVVVMDLILAGRSGVEFLNEFRSYPEWQRLPVIIYTDIAPDEFNQSGGFAQFGVVDYLHKPSASLRDVINSVEAVAALAK